MTNQQSTQRIVVIDIETTGLDPDEFEIIEIGAVREDGATFSQMVQVRNPQKIEDHAEAINHASKWHPDWNENTNTVLPWADRAIDMLLDWLDEYDAQNQWTVIGRYPKFDLGFIFAHAKDDRPNRRLHERGMDIHDLNRWALLAKNMNPFEMEKDDRYRYFGFEPEPVPHRALQGASMEYEQMQTIIRNFS